MAGVDLKEAGQIGGCKVPVCIGTAKSDKFFCFQSAVVWEGDVCCRSLAAQVALLHCPSINSTIAFLPMSSIYPIVHVLIK